MESLKNRIKKIEFCKKVNYLAYSTLRVPKGSLKNVQAIRSSRLASFRKQLYISVFILHILLKNNYTKNNVSRLLTILSSQNSLNNERRPLLYRQKVLFFILG